MWKSIETAPKDGTEIWLGAAADDPRRQRVGVGYWHGRRGWQSSHDDTDLVWRPSHWQEYFVPEPPVHMPGHDETMAALDALTIRRS
jgi:hypothetical protein